MNPITVLLLVAFPLAACTPMLTAKSRDSGETGRANAIIAVFDLPRTTPLVFDDETYEGEWVHATPPLTLIKPDAGPEIDYGSAILSSEKGNNLRCEFKYSIENFEAKGICLNDETGEIFDLKVK